MSKIITIGSIDFELTVPRKSNYNEWLKLFSLDGYKSINDCYSNPSQIKRNVYAWWRSYFASLDNCLGISFKQFCGVKSYNCNFFTLQAIVTWWEEDYIMEITPFHNRIIKVVR